MTQVTYTGSASVWRTGAYGGITVSNGETIEVDADTADALVANQDFERAADVSDDTPDPEFAVLTESIAELEDQLEAGDHDDHLVALRREEEQHKNRSGALDAIDARRSTVADAEAEEETNG